LSKFRFRTGIQKINIEFSQVYLVFILLLKVIFFGIIFSPHLCRIVSLFLIGVTELPNIVTIFSRTWSMGIIFGVNSLCHYSTAVLTAVALHDRRSGTRFPRQL
jgi:hypothetical protein